MQFLRKALASEAPAAVVLIRVGVGAVFLAQGALRCLSPAREAARFAELGWPAPGATALLVAGLELFCGALILVGLLTRLAVLPMLALLAGALVATKAPLLGQYGFWETANAARTAFALLLGSLFLLFVGAGPWSVDAALAERRLRQRRPGPVPLL